MHEYQSQDITTLAKALIQVQRNLQPAFKDATNPFTKSQYATLNSVMAACREALLDNGIWLCQHPVPVEAGYLGLVTKLTHAESGEWQSSLAVVPLPKADPQAVGICMTYLRRYTLSANLGIVTEEDSDGECGEKSPKSGARQGRSVAGAQTQKVVPDGQTQGRPQENASESMPERGHLAKLPKIDGITYQTVTAQDGRPCIVATGNTQAKKELLMGAGFKWNAQRKTWWRYAEAVLEEMKMLLQPKISIGNHNDLLPMLTKGMQATANLNTATLGDRSLYIGMSDIGRYIECPRAMLANQLFATADHPLERLLPLQRGHWFEAGIAPAILSQHPATFQQLEIEVEYEGVPIRAHLDFVLVQQKPATVRILEVKNMTRLADALHAAHEAQVYGQIGLLRAVWNQPAFSLHGENGEVLHHRLTFPDLCKAHFGLNLPSNPEKITLEASVLGLSMNEAQTYGPYVPDKSMLNLCLKNAADLWKYMADYRTGRMSINDMPYAKGFHLLCGYCDWNSDCPKFNDSEHQPEWDADLQRLTALKNSRSTFDAEIKEMEQSLKDAYALSQAGGSAAGGSAAEGWISTGRYRFKVNSQAGKRTLNRDRLQLELQDALGDEHASEKLISWCEDEGKPFERLAVNKIK